MSRSLNRAMLIGNVGGDPELRTAAGGFRVASFSLATSRRGAARPGPAEKAEWHRIVAWKHLAEIAERHVRRGDRLFVEGRLEHRTWEDASGRTRHVTEIVALDLILLGGPRGARAQAVEWPPAPEPEAPRASLDDDLPF